MSKKMFFLLVLFTLIAAGCTEKDTTTISTSDGDADINVSVPETSENDWCQTGASWDFSNPKTGEAMSMEIIGIETIEGIELCKGIYEANTSDDIVKIEYLFSEDGETFKWINYDTDGNIISQMSIENDNITIIDEEGNDLLSEIT